MMIGESSSQSTAAVTAGPSVPSNINNSGHFSSFLTAHQISNDRRTTSMPSGPYAYTLGGGHLPFLDCHGGEDASLMQGFDPASLVHAAGGSATEPEMDAYDCESEEIVEVAEELPKQVGPSRSGSKRSRAAEVHNLSEKRRRSRINEKMKALQKLIPNSNKTDKASMLDEAIDYLKQLQLQVQMLSMRNGLSLHPAFVPGAMPPLQASQICLPFAPDNAPLMHPGMGPLLSGDSSNSSTVNLPSQPSMPSHPSLVPTVSNINDLVASFGMDSQTPHGLISLPGAAEGVFTEVTAANRHLNPIHSSRTGTEMNCLDGSALFFNGQTQLPHMRHLEASSENEHIRKEDEQVHFQHMHVLQEGKKYAAAGGIKAETKDF